ncbi:AgmX/PglI C-terminal domain-containing protein [Haliangium ochraceum]|uniref:AgmX/PglI C-terminal domain-containing protein n=1 Tax=Haliangium ochraceum TaxID=80816 RepID=UPI0005D48026|nr:AgmX/PglI C-terminal domain-containing protein [Haliangium ochraceum]
MQSVVLTALIAAFALLPDCRELLSRYAPAQVRGSMPGSAAALGGQNPEASTTPEGDADGAAGLGDAADSAAPSALAGVEMQTPDDVSSSYGGIDESAVDGARDKKLIGRYIRRQRRPITHCYEKQLAKQPTLSGTVVATFDIEPQGRVRNASAEGMSPAVSRCVARVVRRIVFPRSKTGGSVRVRYPFVFQPADE